MMELLSEFNKVCLKIKGRNLREFLGIYLFYNLLNDCI